MNIQTETTPLTGSTRIRRSRVSANLCHIPLVLACFALSPIAQAISPAPDGGYPALNTAEGDGALSSLTTGDFNSAIGFNALNRNTTGYSNTASGAAALRFNTTGVSNTANGVYALYNNTIAGFNTAMGDQALFSNTTGTPNTAIGVQTLLNNTTGGSNTAMANQALYSNTTGSGNTAIGVQALVSNTIGGTNIAMGNQALYSNTTGSGNTALGASAGFSLTTGSGNVCIGSGVTGSAGENNTTRIRNIGSTAYNTGRFVEVDANGKLGYVSSSRRYKDEIQPMDSASEAILKLKPVSFRYKPGFDPDHVRHFGFVAEEVAEVNPELVVRAADGQIDTVRFDSIDAMLLNEFLKEHHKVEEQDRQLQKQQKQIEALTAGLQKVNDQLELNKRAPRTVENNQ